MTVKTALAPLAALPEGLTVYSNPNDLRRDVHTFVNYVKSRTVKRSSSGSGNTLPAPDFRRLTQLIPNGDRRLGTEAAPANPLYAFEAATYEAANWLSYIDIVAYRLGFVHYRLKGSYRPSPGSEDTVRDNVMRVMTDTYQDFLALSLAEQEQRLLDALVTDVSHSSNELYRTSIRGRLDHFPAWGTAFLWNSGAYFGSGHEPPPQIPFAESRRFLLQCLAECEPGAWYSTQDLIAWLKAEHPFFLIPAQRKPSKRNRPPAPRYSQFYERDAAASPRTPIPDDAPDAFERVEGRFVERFLEGVPLTLGYLDLAYAEEGLPGPPPARGRLAAFRVHERLRQSVRGEVPQPRVTLQPNFEIYIESVFYPAYLIQRLAPLATILREDTTTIFRLDRRKVAAQVAENPGFDPVALLRRLTGHELPQNVATEVREWASQADVFTLYEGFGLVEAHRTPAQVEADTVAQIGEHFRLVRDPAELSARLIEAGEFPLRIAHGPDQWTPVPPRAQTVFPLAAPPAPPERKQPRAVTVQREVLINLYFPEDELFETVRAALLDARCAIVAQKELRMLTVPKHDEPRLTEILKRMRGEYAVRLEDKA